MRFKKAASLLAAAAVATSAFAFSASALSYTYTMEDVLSAPVILNGTPAAMGADGTLDALWAKAEAVDLKAMGKAVRVGLEGNVKLMWDAENLHMLLTVSGDSIAKAEGKDDFNTASFEDEIVVMLSQTWATTDEEADEIYQRDTFNDSDIGFSTRRMGEGDAERKVKEASWGNKDFEAVTKTVLDKIKAGIQSHEINDGTTSFQMQIAIPWVDKSLVENLRIIGLDVDYADWLGEAETYPGIFTEGSQVAKPHLYFSENYAEGLDNPAANAPAILVDAPVGTPAEDALVVAAVKESLKAIPDAADITLEDEAGLAIIRGMYDELDDSIKALLADDYARLTAAEAKIKELKNGGETKPTQSTASASATTNPTASTGPSDADNPGTGVAGSVLPAVLLAGACATLLVLRKKKRD